MSATAVMASANRILRAFRRAEATSSHRAKTPEEVGCRRNLAFRKLERRGVLVEVSGGRYYLDEDAAEEYATYRRTIFLLSLAVGLVALGILLYQNIR